MRLPVHGMEIEANSIQRSLNPLPVDYLSSDVVLWSCVRFHLLSFYGTTHVLSALIDLLLRSGCADRHTLPTLTHTHTRIHIQTHFLFLSFSHTHTIVLALALALSHSLTHTNVKWSIESWGISRLTKATIPVQWDTTNSLMSKIVKTFETSSRFKQTVAIRGKWWRCVVLKKNANK